MSQMAVCESCGERFDYGSGVMHRHSPAWLEWNKSPNRKRITKSSKNPEKVIKAVKK